MKQFWSKCAKSIAWPLIEIGNLYYNDYDRQKMGKTDGTNVVQNTWFSS